jgi:hypothetical protein
MNSNEPKFYENITTTSGKTLVPVIVHCGTCGTWDVPGHYNGNEFIAHRQRITVAQNQTGYWVDEIGIYHWTVPRYNHCACEHIRRIAQ